jgi:FxsC-like protein
MRRTPAAIASSYSSEFEVLRPDGLARITAAMADNKVAVMLVHPLAIADAKVQALLTKLDEPELANIGILVPWNTSVAETETQRLALLEQLRRTMPNRHKKIDLATLAVNVRNAMLMNSTMKAMLARASQCLLRCGVVHKAAVGDEHISKPGL